MNFLLLIIGATVASSSLSPCYEERGKVFDAECSRIGIPCHGAAADELRSFWTGAQADSALNCNETTDPEPGSDWMDGACGATNRALTAEGRKRALLYARFTIKRFPTAAARVLLTKDELKQTRHMPTHTVQETLAYILDSVYVGSDAIDSIQCELAYAARESQSSKSVSACLASRHHYLLRYCSVLGADCGQNGSKVYGKDEPVFSRVLGRHMLKWSEDECPSEDYERGEDFIDCKHPTKSLTPEAGLRLRLASEFLIAIRPEVSGAMLLTKEEQARIEGKGAYARVKAIRRAFARAVAKNHGNAILTICPIENAVRLALNSA